FGSSRSRALPRSPRGWVRQKTTHSGMNSRLPSRRTGVARMRSTHDRLRSRYGHIEPLTTRSCSRQLADRDSPSARVALTAISVQEQMSGWQANLAQARQPAHLARVYQFLVGTLLPSWGSFPILEFNAQAIARFEHFLTLRLNVGRMD